MREREAPRDFGLVGAEAREFSKGIKGKDFDFAIINQTSVQGS